MHDELPFRVLFVGMYVAGFGLRGYFASHLKRQGERVFPVAAERNRSGRFRLMFQGVMFFLWLIIVFSYALYPSWMERFHLPIPIWLRYTGAAAGFFAFPFLVYTYRTLGRYWSPLPGLRENHQLVTSGPYRFVRHPMYTTMIVLFLSFSLTTANLPVTVSSILAIILTIRWGLKEEGLMIGRFGREYEEYIKRTGAFLPRWGRSV
jgi:protein-S-isoprenylcysteine O-methyltransferase Ste14